MSFGLSKEFRFESAHRLPRVAEGHKCGRLHGHSFTMEVHVAGALDETAGWVVDYGDIKRAVAPLIEQLDHHYLNDIPGLENPTSEILARWAWRALEEKLSGLSRITIKETCTSSCSYDGRSA